MKAVEIELLMKGNLSKGMSDAQAQAESLNAVLKRLGMTIGGVFTADKLKDFATHVANVRGEFQKTEIAFKTMLGSASAANDLVTQLIHTAATTPFGMTEVTQAAKQLLAYGVAADEVNDTLIRLGDIASGLSIPMGDLAYLYGTTMVQGRLFTQDLRQFTGRGIPLTEELARVMGVAKDEIADLVTEGKIGFPEVKKAIENLTNEGSKFGGLMEEQSKTISGQIANIEDAVEQMFNEIGKSSEGFISGILNSVSTIVENWKTIGKAIGVVATAFGAYKAAMLVVNTIQTINNRLIQEAAVQQKLAAMSGVTLSNAEAMAAAKTMVLKGAFTALNTAFKANAIGLVVSLIASAVAALNLFGDETKQATDLSTKFGEKASTSIARVNTLTTTLNGLNKGTSTYTKVLEELNGILEEYGVQQIKEGDNIDAVNAKRAEAIELIKQEAIERQRLNQLDTGAQDYINKVNEAQRVLQEKLNNAETGKTILGTVFSSGNSEIQENAAAIATIVGQVVEQNIDLIANKTGEEYQKGIDEIYKTIQDRMRRIGISEETIQKTWWDDGFFTKTNIIFDYINTLQSAKEENDRFTEAVNANAEAEREAAESTTTLESRVAAAEKSLEAAGDDVHSLHKRISQLMAQYSDNNIGFHINIDGEVPSWMMNMGIKDLSTLAKRFTALGQQAGANGLNVNGKHFSKQELLQRGADYSNAAEQKQIELDKKEAEQKAKQKEREKKAASAARKAEQEESRRKQRQEQLKEREAQYAASIQQEASSLEIDKMEEGTKKVLAQIDIDYKKRIDEIEKKRREFIKANKEAGVSTGDDGLTSEQRDLVARDTDNAEEQRKQKTVRALKEEIEEKREQLKQYGSYQQKRLAIAEEYAEKIRKAQAAGEEWKINGLQKQRDSALAQAEIENATIGIDWDALYGGIDHLSKEMLKPMLDQLEAYVHGDEYKNAGAENQQKITELLNQLRTYVQSDHSATWKDLAAATQDFTSAVATYNDLAAKEREAYIKLNSAKTKFSKGEITKEEYEAIAAAAEGLSAETLAARDEMQNLGETLNATSEKVKNYISPLTNALQNAGTWKKAEGFSDIQSSIGAIDELKGTLDSSLASMGDGIAKTVGSGLSSVIGSGLSSIGGGLSSFLSQGIGGVIGIVAQIPKLILNIVGAVKNFVTGILNSFSELLSFSWLDDLVNSILEAIGNLIDTIFHIPENLVKAIGSIIVGVKDLIGSILNTVTFGGFGSLIDTSNAKEVAETTEKLTESNERLTSSVDKLKEELSNTSGWAAIDTAKQAMEDQQTINDQTMDILKTQMGYHAAHHSNAYYWGLSESDYDAMNKTLANYAAKYGKEAKTANSLADIYKLSPEEMDYIRTYNVDLWKKMLDQGKYDKSEYWENYADLAGKMEEISESLKESLTQTSFDSMRSSFIDDLMDMDKSAQDFADNFQEYMMRSILNAKISDLLGNELQEFYDKWAEYAESDNELTQAEEDELRRMWDALTEKGLEIRDQVSNFTGYTGEESGTSQTGKSGSFAALSQDQGTKLEGMFTSDIMHLSSIDGKITDLSAQMSASEVHLARIAANSDYLKRLEEIAETVYAMKRDGVKMK